MFSGWLMLVLEISSSVILHFRVPAGDETRILHVPFDVTVIYSRQRNTDTLDAPDPPDLSRRRSAGNIAGE